MMVTFLTHAKIVCGSTGQTQNYGQTNLWAVEDNE